MTKLSRPSADGSAAAIYYTSHFDLFFAPLGLRTKFLPSSSLTCFKNSQSRQFINFRANVPCGVPSQRVPTIAQQNRPPYVPLFVPSYSEGSAAGHTLYSPTFSPPGCRPHFFTSQQFFRSILLSSKGIAQLNLPSLRGRR